MNREYFYGEQADSYSFYRIPRQLITGEKYKGLSVEAKLLYGMMLDRMGLSLRNGWLDKTGRVYIYYTVEEIQSDLGCGHVKAGRLLAELDTVKGIGLIERVRQGQGKPTKIYVKKFSPDPPPQGEKSGLPRQPQNSGLDSAKAEFRSAASCRSGHTENGGAERQKPAGSYMLDSLRETTTKIINIRAYLLTALYNAPLTIGPYYSAAVRHDSMRQ